MIIVTLLRKQTYCYASGLKLTPGDRKNMKEGGMEYGDLDCNFSTTLLMSE